MRITLLFVSQTILDEIASDSRISTEDVRDFAPLVVEDNVIKHTVHELLEEYADGSRISNLLIGAAGRHVAAHILARYSQMSQMGEEKRRVE